MTPEAQEKGQDIRCSKSDLCLDIMFRQRQNGHHFATGNFMYATFIFIEITLKFIPNCPVAPFTNMD